jgi:hypothetical protein
MKKIKEIRIQNFKAFKKEQVFPINGKASGLILPLNPPTEYQITKPPR